MITNFEEQTAELTKDELWAANQLRMVLQKRTGKENAITTSEIISGFDQKLNYKLSDSRVRKIIHFLRVTWSVPMLMGTSQGYYIASTKEEFRTCCTSLKERATAIIVLHNEMIKQLEKCSLDSGKWIPSNSVQLKNQSPVQPSKKK